MNVNDININASKGKFMIAGDAKQFEFLGDDIKCKINWNIFHTSVGTKYLGIQAGECLKWH